MRLFIWALMLAALLFGSSTAQAQIPGIKTFVHAGLEAENSKPAPGETVTLALTMRPDAGWHGYWQNPGDAGVGLVLDWKLPPGVTVGEPRFPVPDTLVISGFMNYIYDAPHAILVDVKMAPDIAIGTKLPVSVEAQWLACTDRVCVPQRGNLALELVADSGGAHNSKRAEFDKWRAALPVALDRVANYAVSGKTIQIAVPFPESAELSKAHFFPVTLDMFDYVAPQSFRRSGDWLVVETLLSPDFKGPPPETLQGLLRIGGGQGLLIQAKSGVVPAGGKTVVSGSAATTAAATPPIYWLLFAALAGGVLLNIMPCVFPILGLKALALAKAGGDEKAARSDALAYTAGVVLSCLALGAVMLALRAGGQEVGWAFQLQSPAFVLFLLVLMIGVTANLAGVFELGAFDFGDALTRRPGLMGSFWTGVLAAVVATPCTGPFMAAALGAALLLPTEQALALFAVLGIGISLPFLLIAYVPALRNRLPKPGPWLGTFRKAMAVPMGLTAIALLWLLVRLTGQQGLLIGVLSASAIVLVLILRLRNRERTRYAGLGAFALCLMILGVAVKTLPDVSERNALASANILGAEPFSDARLATLRTEGKSVFVYFTADWCVTCKINESAVLERAETVELFADNDIAVLRGDFTRHDPAIARFLGQQQAAGVPLYVFYPKGAAGQKLPQLLTAATLADAVEK
jgi:DsbC/DsbD-like thiol-disulfide interchange protein/cytochrome c biogenesis protein CcdA